MTLLNLLSFIGIFGLCAIAWLFSEHHSPKYFPWRVVLVGILLLLLLGALVFVVPGSRELFQGLSGLLDILYAAADVGARFVFGQGLVPAPGAEPIVLSPLLPDATSCPTGTVGQVAQRLCGIPIGFIFAFRVLPGVIFFAGLIGLLYGLGIMRLIVSLFAKIFYPSLHLSGAETWSGITNIFLGVEAIIAVRDYIAKMTRSELCTILTCGFGTASSATLAAYVALIRPVFPNILGHLMAASVMAIPACFVLSKILVPETRIPLTTGNTATGADLSDRVLVEDRRRPLDATLSGVGDGVRVAATIAGALILILGLVFLLTQLFGWLATLPSPVGDVFQVLTLQTILGAAFLPATALTGVSLNWEELWQASVIVGQRFLQTEIPAYQTLAAAAALPDATRIIGDRALLIISYALSGFANLAAVGIFVGGAVALAPGRHRDITSVAWKALFAGTLATFMVACVAGVFDMGDRSILGTPQVIPSPLPSAPNASPTVPPTTPPFTTAPPTAPTALPTVPPAAAPTAPPILPTAPPAAAPTAPPVLPTAPPSSIAPTLSPGVTPPAQ